MGTAQESELSMTGKRTGKPWTPPPPIDVQRLRQQAPAQAQPVQPAAASARVADCVVEEVPAACPRCQSTDREQLEGTITRNISGMTRDGRTFTRVRWAYCTCRKCSQRYRVIRRENSGD